MTTEAVLVELPGDRLYHDDCRIQTFTYGDASALSLLPKTKDTKKLFDVVGRRINLPVHQLTLQDFWFIMYWQRINSYSSFPVKFNWTCRHCKTKNIDELSGSKLIIEDIDPEYHHGTELDFPDAGPIKLRLKLVGDEIQARKFIRDNSITDLDDELFDQLLAACMLEPNGGTLGERLERIQKMSSDDQFLLKAFESEFDYGVKNYCEFVCENPECQEVAKVNYQFDLANFFPSIQDKSNVRSRILSRKAPLSADRVSEELRPDESSVHKGDAYKESQNTQGQTRSNESTDSSEKVKETIEITPEELDIMIRQGIAEATGDETQFGNLDEITKGR